MAKDIGGKVRPASGAFPGHKGDIERGAVLFESKSTTGRSIRVMYSWLHKITKEALAERKSPALTLSFVREDGTAEKDGDWVLIPLARYKRLIATEEEANE